MVGPIGKAVNGTSNNFLSGSAFAGDQNENVGLSDPFSEHHDVHHVTGYN